ncbi:MAG: endonuclease/exonuclease/phosphatase family protein [Flavitalea sp.]
MPFYQDIKPNTKEGKRTIERLLKLREKLQAEIPIKQLESNLLLASWNIREFDSAAYGPRMKEAMYYIAEIISKFDIIAVQEIREDLAALRKLMSLLGSQWSYIMTDITAGKQGNGERLAFIFDSRKVKFGGLAGEMVLPPFERKDPETGQTIYDPVRQLVRTPYTCGFKAGWTNFQLTTVHILYGNSVANDPERIKEIEAIAASLSKRADGPYEWSNNNVLLGDFNIFKPSDHTYDALLKAGFVIPEELQHLPSNAIRNKFYDQIAFKVRPNQFDTTGRAGVFDYYQVVYTDADEQIYKEDMEPRYSTTAEGEPRENPSLYYKTYWRTHQMSDHLPMWVEIKIDHTDQYLSTRLIPPQKD